MDEYDAADLEHTHLEGFPCPQSDRIEDGLAQIITGLQSVRLGMATIGTTALELRVLARKRHHMRYTRAQKQDAPPVQRSA